VDPGRNGRSQWAAVPSVELIHTSLPAPHVCDYLSREASRKLYSEGTEFQIGRIETVANTGWHNGCATLAR